MSNADTYAKVFETVLAEMEQGRAPWVRPWSGGNSHGPHNALTGRPYSGGNVLALWCQSALKGYGVDGWVTFKQALSAKCVVRKGEKGTAVYYMSIANGKDKADGEPTDRFFFAKGFTVFNVAQLDDLEPGAVAALTALHSAPVVRSEYERLEAAEATVTATGASISHGGPRAFYTPSADTITMPERDSFNDASGYYGTLFHELSHWTGAEKRLNRVQSGRFGGTEYAFEELVAELGAAFLSATHGLDTVTQSAAYLRMWAKGCRANPAMLASAASLAQKAANYIAPVATPETVEAFN